MGLPSGRAAPSIEGAALSQCSLTRLPKELVERVAVVPSYWRQ